MCPPKAVSVVGATIMQFVLVTNSKLVVVFSSPDFN